MSVWFVQTLFSQLVMSLLYPNTIGIKILKQIYIHKINQGGRMINMVLGEKGQNCKIV